METNKIYCIDVLEGLRQLEDNSIDLIITSPPYNKIGLNGYRKHGRYRWGEILYNGDPNNDNMDEEEYKAWQIEILKECYRVLKPNGSMFYNHKNRIIVGEGCISTPYEWLLQTPFLIRQEIVWDRLATPNFNKCRFFPTTERIYWLTKTTKPRFDVRNADMKNEIWAFNFERNTKHPALFPLEMPDNIIKSIGENLIVLDPFMGSGTTAIAALKNNCQYIGFEKYQEYVDMANERIAEYNDKHRNP